MKTALVPTLARLHRALGEHFVPLPSSYEVVPVYDLIHALRSVLARRRDDRARATLARFADRFDVEVGPAGVPRLRAFARENLAALGALVTRRDHGVRHAAVYTLGIGGDARALEPLLANLLHQQHWCDHDHIFMALRRLGERATAAAFEIATTDADPRRRAVASNALLHCRNKLPYVRRMYPAGPASEDELIAFWGYERGLLYDHLTPARSSDPGLRYSALRAVESVLYAEPSFGRRMPAALRAGWSAVLAELSTDVAGGCAGVAAELIGSLGLTERAARLIDAARARVDDQARGAIRGLARLNSTRARRAFAALLDEAPLDRACLTALALGTSGALPSDPALRRRATPIMMRGLVELPEHEATLRGELQHALADSPVGRALLLGAANGADAARAAAATRALAYHTVMFNRRQRWPRSATLPVRYATLVARGLRPAARRAYLSAAMEQVNRVSAWRSPASRKRARRRG